MNIAKHILFGMSVGDALGVPVEFKSRVELKQNPVNDMIGHGTYNQPAGTWSDDSSLAFCLAESLIDGYDLFQIGENFVKWYRAQIWTPHGKVFDIGGTTRRAIKKLIAGVDPEKAGEKDEFSNGNGALMRILPLLLYIKNKKIEERYEITKDVASITHRHLRSVMACFFYLEFALEIICGRSKHRALKRTQDSLSKFFKKEVEQYQELIHFKNLMTSDFTNLSDAKINSSGYVMHTLEASIWCVITSDNYRDTVLKAVNLGDDTDTTGAVAGGLAGLIYGYRNIPQDWLNKLVRKDDILKLSEKLDSIYY